MNGPTTRALRGGFHLSGRRMWGRPAPLSRRGRPVRLRPPAAPGAAAAGLHGQACARVRRIQMVFSSTESLCSPTETTVPAGRTSAEPTRPPRGRPWQFRAPRIWARVSAGRGPGRGTCCDSRAVRRGCRNGRSGSGGRERRGHTSSGGSPLPAPRYPAGPKRGGRPGDLPPGVRPPCLPTPAGPSCLTPPPADTSPLTSRTSFPHP